MGSGCCGGKSAATASAPEYSSTKSATRPMQREYFGKPPFTNINFSTRNPLKLTDGYLKEPLLPLEDALKPLDGKINQLSHYITEAKTQCHFPSQHHLTRDESAAIYIYTMRWGDGCLYDHLQAAWKSEDRAKLKPWFKYFKLFRTALDKLPNANTEIWQGTAYDEKLKEQLSSKSLSVYSAMGSCSLSEKEVKTNLEKKSGRKMILVAYDSLNGKSAAGYTAGDSKEVIIWPGTKLGRAKYTVDQVTGSVIAHLTSKPIREAESTVSTISASDIHFVCPYKGCGNRCPGDHKGNHCHTFAFLSHECQHHCGTYNRCERCDKSVPNLCKCYNCGSAFCEKCCFK